MIAALLMAAATPSAPPPPPPPPTAVDRYEGTAIEAERRFAARARAGQWRAFRETSAPDAVMFVPEPVEAHAWLLKQREVAHPVQWSASQSFVSCDGLVAVNTGPWWQDEAGVDGYFTTVWRGGDIGWLWVYDGGAPLATPRPRVADPTIERADCSRAPIPMAPARRIGEQSGGDMSPDRTLWWAWKVDATGARTFTARLWDGKQYRLVVADNVPAPAAQ